MAGPERYGVGGVGLDGSEADAEHGRKGEERAAAGDGVERSAEEGGEDEPGQAPVDCGEACREPSQSEAVDHFGETCPLGGLGSQALQLASLNAGLKPVPFKTDSPLTIMVSCI